MSRKRRYFINIPKTVAFLSDAYGLKTKEINYYHLKVWHPEFEGVFDWYHTQGTLVANTENYTSNIGEVGEEEELALKINDYVLKQSDNCR